MTATMSDKELSLLSINEGQVSWTKEQRTALIDVLRVRHATEADLAVFFHQARRTQLDPFLRQLYMIARREWDTDAQALIWRQTFQTGIDGFRVVGHRRARQLGVELSYEDTVYFDEQGKGYEVWINEEKPPAAVRVAVTLGSARFPFVARYHDYVPLTDEYEPDTYVDGKKIKGKKTGNKAPSGMWKTRPTGQLEKCAEAGALRRACPQDLSGIYEFTEMERQSQDQPVTTLVDDGSGQPQPKRTAPKRINWIHKIQRARDLETLRKLWHEAKDAGEMTPAIEQAINDRGARLQQADAPSTGQGSESEPSESGESAPEDAQSNVHPAADASRDPGQDVPTAGTGEPSSEELPFLMQDRLIAAGVTTEEAARALSTDERDRILGVAGWGGDEERAFEWAVSHIDQPHHADE